MQQCWHVDTTARFSSSVFVEMTLEEVAVLRLQGVMCNGER